ASAIKRRAPDADCVRMSSAWVDPVRPGPAAPARDPDGATSPVLDMFRLTHEAMAVIRLPDGEIVEENDAFCRLTDLPRDQIRGHSSYELGLWAELGDDASARNSLCETPWHENLFATIGTPSGKIVTLHLSAERILRGDEEPSVVVVRAAEPAELAGQAG